MGESVVINVLHMYSSTITYLIESPKTTDLT